VLHSNFRGVEPSLVRGPRGTFTDAELVGLPDPVRRMFTAAIAPGTPLATTAVMEMRGEIRLSRWTRFRARQVVTPQTGFVWSARAGLVTGFDRYVGGEGEMRWKLLGLVPVQQAVGPDISRSAAGRAAGEAILVPTALLPRFGVEWTALDDDHVSARLRLDAYETQCHCALDTGGQITAWWFQRWGDPDNIGNWSLHPFGADATAHRTFDGVTIASAGQAGWHYGTDRWDEGVFFRFEITAHRLATDADVQRADVR
jgi:hypothetical protein